MPTNESFKVGRRFPPPRFSFLARVFGNLFGEMRFGEGENGETANEKLVERTAFQEK